MLAAAFKNPKPPGLPPPEAFHQGDAEEDGEPGSTFE